MSSFQKYRPDVDGLRAIAVLAVVIYHAFPIGFTGGFIGVDVFFVISGYLITGILIKSLSERSFSILDFYSRRIRRIFPALFIVLLSSLCFGWFYLFDSEFQQLGKHAASGAGFAANLVLWNESGYFDAAAEMKPLLHLWSLGIEEQFYLVWPFALWLGWKFRRVSVFIFLMLVAISFYSCVIISRTDPVEAFYSPFTRFWELAAGGVLAYLKVTRVGGLSSRTGWISEVCAVGALMLLGLGFFLIDKSKGFPGAWALIPVAAALLLIGPGEGSKVSRLVLANKISVWIGLISFPLYLWHWPLLSLANVTQGEIPSSQYRFFAVLVSVFLAWVTYKFVETPVRSLQRGRTVVALSVLVFAVGAGGFYVYKGGAAEIRGLKQAAGDLGHEKYFDYLSDNYYVCTEKTIRDRALVHEGHIRCMQSKPASQIDIAIIGDSHAEHLFNGLAKALPGLNVAYYIKGSPPFVSNLEFKEIYDFIVSSQSTRKVIITMHWIKRLDQVPVNSTIEREVFASTEFLLQNGKDVYVVDDVPRFPFDPKKCVTKAKYLKNACSIPRGEANKELGFYKDQLIGVSRRDPRVKYISISQYVCRDDKCGMARNGHLLYRDRNHLNVSGSNLIGASIVRDNPDLVKGFGGL
ncbi:acyltransferase family protein [Pseudomonas asiatica]|uniref:acyltransferase family protein n=1 Tax=Pseudomonas asiatica TaxID=2219225 RepID=UPI00383A9362